MSVQYGHLMRGAPLRLTHPPIVEATCEVRFAQPEGVPADMLPGLLYPNLRARYPEMQRQPVADVPSPIRAADPNLQYVPWIRFVGEKESIGLGDRVASVSVLSEYQNWETFRERIFELWAALEEVGALNKVERVSIKFINIIDDPATPLHELLRLKVELGDTQFQDQRLHLVMQTARPNFLEILQVVTHAQVNSQISPSSAPRPGTVLDVDVLSNCDLSDFVTRGGLLIDEAHEIAKQVFLGAVTDKALKSWGALYA
ncbi:TIGR04255 family protein [Luteimonas sp. Sa2BVA3]|uniref:TIGR04255 family protein n=1 Tax=Luteimonas colneyensis TaxID=2762230 RepID=A0ABR8UGF1_9GAMM|nr:TIGR04255 family protein [Luteimonas colneyensis]MBD7987097.1 TIGR04255 family protein [Luteimonas colneyensis]